MDYQSLLSERLLSLRISIGKRLFGTVGPRDVPVGWRISPSRMIKWPCQAPELEAHRFAAANTTLPVPRLYKAHRWHGRLAIEMEYIDGCCTLQSCWRKMSDDQKRTIVDEFSGYYQQMRAAEPPDHVKVSSTDGGPCRDIRIGTVKLCGPFDDSAAFHQCLRGGVPIERCSSTFGSEVGIVHERSYGIRFTHGDLGVQNILIKNGRIAAIIDWECGGWYPEYWEYTKAHYNMVLLPEFYAMLREKIDRYDMELKAERTLWRIFDQPLDHLDI